MKPRTPRSSMQTWQDTRFLSCLSPRFLEILSESSHFGRESSHLRTTPSYTPEGGVVEWKCAAREVRPETPEAYRPAALSFHQAPRKARDMSNVDYLGLRIDLKRLEESLTERLARIEAEANPSQDAITVAAVERMLASKHQEAEDEDIEDDFAGGTTGIDGSPWLMPWRSHHAELVLGLAEVGYDKWAALLKQAADTNSLKKPFTKADEAEVIKAILKCLTAFKKEVGGDEESASNFVGALGSMDERIRVAVETIAAAEKEKTAIPSADSADKKEIFPNGIPEDVNVVALAVTIHEEQKKPRGKRRSNKQIAREYVGKTGLKPDSLLRQVRRATQ